MSSDQLQDPHLPPIHLLSQELIDEIIDTVNFFAEQNSWAQRWDYLANCALVCRSFTPRAQMHLFTQVSLPGLPGSRWVLEEDCSRVAGLLEIMEHNPTIAKHVRELSLYLPRGNTSWLYPRPEMLRLMEKINSTGFPLRSVLLSSAPGLSWLKNASYNSGFPQLYSFFKQAIAPCITTLRIELLLRVPVELVTMCTHLQDLKIVYSTFTFREPDAFGVLDKDTDTQQPHNSTVDWNRRPRIQSLEYKLLEDDHDIRANTDIARLLTDPSFLDLSSLACLTTYTDEPVQNLDLAQKVLDASKGEIVDVMIEMYNYNVIRHSVPSAFLVSVHPSTFGGDTQFGYPTDSVWVPCNDLIIPLRSVVSASNFQVMSAKSVFFHEDLASVAIIAAPICELDNIQEEPKKFQFSLLGFDSDADFDEPDAVSSSPNPYNSSPISYPNTHILDSIPFDKIPELSENDDDDLDYHYDTDSWDQTPSKRKSPQSNEEKTRLTLEFMRTTFSRFSLHQFMDSLFSSDDRTIKNVSNVFLAANNHLKIMDIWEKKNHGNSGELDAWVIERAAQICAKEASWLSDRAKEGKYTEDAQFLRISPQDVNVKMINEFHLSHLTERYERTTPKLQIILKSVIAREKKTLQPGSRDPDHGRTLVTSMLLNLRSRKLNYHQTINGLLFWDNQVPKRIIHAFNRFGVTTSYPFQGKAITSLSKDSVYQARKAANDRSKIKMLPYDNFNWTSRAWESTALHKSTTHDEVSALLVILSVPKGREAHQITSMDSFANVAETRHTLPPRKSLISILPSFQDQQLFRENSILHVLRILVEEIEDFTKYSKEIPLFSDPLAIPPQKTEEYYLPTFDQEQGSTRGNMVVLEHYFGKVLDIPKSRFETEMFTVLGDRLTTVRDRAAQDQRAVDRSNHRFDHLASFTMVSGLMHFCLNFIQAIAGNYWGQEKDHNPISLSSFRKIMPNRSEVNNRKIDYYGWLRFLDVILRSLIIQAALEVSGTETFTTLGTNIPTYTRLLQIATSVVDKCLLPSPDRLEEVGIKTLKGNTHTGNAVLLMHDLMTLCEMQHAIKHGHPGRIARMIKYWLPMFYAAGSHNYANECMELLHNITHDWPTEYAQVAFNGMLVNPSGKDNGWKPTDIRVEHLNDKIKERAHGSSMIQVRGVSCRIESAGLQLEQRGQGRDWFPRRGFSSHLSTTASRQDFVWIMSSRPGSSDWKLF